MSDLPNSWVTRALGAVNQFASSTINPATRPEEVFELYSIPSFPTGAPERLLGSAIGSTKQTVAPDDVLISKINPRINRVWTVRPKTSEVQIASSEWIGFRSASVQPAFANYYFKSPDFREILCSEVAGVGGSLTRAQPRRVAEYPIPIAPAAEQTRIANQLDTLLTRIQSCNDRFDAIPALLKRFRNSVLSAAVSGRLTGDLRSGGAIASNSTVSSLWRIPTSWRWARADEVTGFITKGTTPSKEKMASGSGEVPYIKVYNLGFDGRLDFSVDPTFVDSTTHRVVLKRSITFPGDVLMNIVGPPLGKVAIVPDSHQEWNINQAIARFRPVPGLLSPYLAHCLMSTELIAYAVSQAKATVGQLNLTLEICRALPIPMPPEKEQAEIVRRVEALFTLADRIEARCTAARAQAQRLSPLVLAKAFRGELVPQDPTDEPASDLLARLASVTPSRKNKQKPPLSLSHKA